MQVLCITGVINTLFEQDTNRFICTRKNLAEKMRTEFFNSGGSHVFIYISSGLQYIM